MSPEEDSQWRALLCDAAGAESLAAWSGLRSEDLNAPRPSDLARAALAMISDQETKNQALLDLARAAVSNDKPELFAFAQTAGMLLVSEPKQRSSARRWDHGVQGDASSSWLKKSLSAGAWNCAKPGRR